MAKYIMLANWTDQGIQNVKGSPGRLDAARATARQFGAEITDFYMTMGAYDMVVTVEAPSDDVIAKFVLALGSVGNVRSTTLKAFSESEYREIIGSLR